MSEELTITKEMEARVLEASGKCPEAREVLKVLFPSVFRKKKKKPEYCCSSFRGLHNEGILTYHPEYTQSQFIKTKTWPEFCPFCKASAYPI